MPSTTFNLFLFAYICVLSRCQEGQMLPLRSVTSGQHNVMSNKVAIKKQVKGISVGEAI